MIKKFLFVAFVALPVMVFAQESQKIAYVNSMEVVVSMPEYKLLQDSLKIGETEFQAEMKVISDEYNKKLSDYVAQQDSLSESIKLRRTQELEDLRQRAQTYQESASQRQDAMQQRLSGPIQDKLQKAINEVGKENNFLYIANSQAFLYISSSATDATPLVKKKLGVQ
jgi:outer membrane protein